MSAPTPLSPTGTVRHLFELERRSASPDLELDVLLAAAVAHDLPKVAVQLARALAKATPNAPAEERDDLALLGLAALIDARQGSTRTPLTVPHLAALYPTLPIARLSRALSAVASPRLAGALGVGAPLHVEGTHLYLGRALRLERDAAQRLSTRLLPRPAPEGLERALAEVLASPAMTPGGGPITLTEEQQAAIRGVFTQPLCLITGGPGTGKTSVVLGLLRTLVRLGASPHELALAAPTGKAAQRMSQALRQGLSGLSQPLAAPDQALLELTPTPLTLHRLLGYSPSQQTFQHHPHHPLPARWVVVDEGSMVGLELFDRLLAALSPEAHLILLGDADQLPSVEAGAVFRDLVQLGRGVSRLTYSHRMRSDDPAGKKILEAAQVIQAGVGPELFTERVPIKTTAQALTDSGVELLLGRDPRRTRDEFLDRWLRQAEAEAPTLDHWSRRTYLYRGGHFRDEDQAALRGLLAHHQKRQILTITRGDATPTGAAALNQAIHRRWLERRDLSPSLRFAPGEVVIALRNDYARGLYNGDVGVVVTVAVDREVAEPMAVFPVEGGFIPHGLYALGDSVELAHALTVHKAQGSEYESVAIFLPEEDLPLLTKELLYTALTRAKRSVVFVGDSELLLTGATRVVERHVGLRERLT